MTTPMRTSHSGPAEPGPGRRALLGSGVGATLAGGAAVANAAAPRAASSDDGESPAGADRGDDGAEVVPFFGPRQAGVATPPPAHTRWVALDLAKGASLDDLRRILRIWTEDMGRLTQGRPMLADHAPELSQDPRFLTVSVALGRSAFERVGRDDLAPAWLGDLPPFATDALQDRWSGGDIVLQIGSQSPTTCAHAHRSLVTGAGAAVRPRWVQAGYRRPSERPRWTAERNAMGQVDGTVQPVLDGPDDHLIWRGAEDGIWAGASTLVLRRIAMNLDTWESLDPAAKENAIGRRLSDGAPLTGGGEHTPPDLTATTGSGLPVIDPGSHMRRAMPRAAHERFLRRPYSYEETHDLSGGPLEAKDTHRSPHGLLFAAYCADAERQFVPVQRRLAEQDLLNIWTRAVGSCVAVVLPGVEPGEHLGESVLA